MLISATRFTTTRCTSPLRKVSSSFLSWNTTDTWVVPGWCLRSKCLPLRTNTTNVSATTRLASDSLHFYSLPTRMPWLLITTLSNRSRPSTTLWLRERPSTTKISVPYSSITLRCSRWILRCCRRSLNCSVIKWTTSTVIYTQQGDRISLNRSTTAKCRAHKACHLSTTTHTQGTCTRHREVSTSRTRSRCNR